MNPPSPIKLPLRLHLALPILGLIVAYVLFLPTRPWLTASLTKWSVLVVETVFMVPFLLWTVRCIVWTSVPFQNPEVDDPSDFPALPFFIAIFMHHPAKSIAEALLSIGQGSIVYGLIGIALVWFAAYYYSWVNNHAAIVSWRRTNPAL